VKRRTGDAADNKLAWEQYQGILIRDPSYVPALESIVELDTDLSRWPEAVNMKQRSIAAKPHPAAGDYEQLGELLLRVRQEQEGRDALQHALSLDPYNFKAHLYLGVLFRAEQLWTEAQAHLEFVRRYSPDADPGTYRLLYEVYMAQGQPRAAAEAVKVGLRFFPDNSNLQQLSARR
jgi:tetratricopeptide (TPR) repeat protein